jgi:MFS family permease
MKIGRRPVLLITTLFVLGSMVWQAEFNGAAQWYLSCALNGVGTSAYQAVIQLSIFDMFFVHQRSTSLSFYLFGQQLGSMWVSAQSCPDDGFTHWPAPSLGLITGGAIADTRGWRWSGWVAAIIEAGTFLLILGGFEETMFPRFLFDKRDELPITEHGVVVNDMGKPANEEDGKKGLAPTHTAASERVGEVHPGYEKRTLMQKLRPWDYQPEDKTTYWQYFKRPFFLFAFPNVVLVSYAAVLRPTNC